MNQILVILGPTATGKTDIALQIASKFNGELIAADSRQVYKSLDIGTGKLPGRKSKIKKGRDFWEIDGINIWMYDVVSPKKQYTVSDYVKDANNTIDNISKRNKLPIIVGGTGLYIKALLEGLDNLSIPMNRDLREEKLSLSELQQRLQNISPDRWEKLNQSDRQNPRRLLRSIELASMNPYIEKQVITGLSKRFGVLKIGLTASKEILNKKVDLRVLSRLDQGMIEEARNLNKKGVTFKRMRQLGLEYGILADFLENKITRNQLITIMQTKIHQYVKRQLTWFKKMEDINWFDVTDKKFFKKVENLVRKWYYLDQYDKEN